MWRAAANPARWRRSSCAIPWRPFTNLTVRVAYTWLDARNTSDDTRLDRRREHRGSAGLDYEFVKGLSACFNALLVGERRDSDYTAFPPAQVTLPAYEKLDVGLRWQACRYFALHGRIENLTDGDHEEVYGFPALGRTFTGGATLQF
jgi:outer membrane cobalamin receptor